MSLPQTEPADAARSLGAIAFDARAFIQHLSECDWSDEEKCAYVQMIWEILVQFIDLGFGAHPLQQVCGQVGGSLDLSGASRAHALEWKDQDQATNSRSVRSARPQEGYAP